MKRKTLGGKLLIGLSLLAVLLSACISAVVGLQYRDGMMANYSALAFSYARTAAEYIDGDRALSYLETLEEDDYYREVQEFLNISQRNSSLKYYYVFVPCADDLVYIWDADNEDGACPLGYHEEYMEGGEETVEKVFRKDPIEEIGVYNDESYGYIAAAFSPVFNSAGEPVALVGVDLSMPGIRQAIFRFVLSVVLSVVVVTAVSMLAFNVFVRRQIIRPVQLLNGAAKDMVGHLERDDAFRIDIRTGDEIEELADSFTQMDTELREYLRKLASVTAEKERIGAELNVATQIQADMLPRIFPAFPERKEFDIYASMTPAKEVGGDFYDFFLIDEDHLALVMADVSGKGVPAALFMVIAKTLIKNHAQMGEYSPAKVLMRANEQLCEGNEAELFVTVWLAILEISTGKGMAANAGHEHPTLRRAGGNYELVMYRHSPAVAAIEGIRFREHEFELRPGDSLFVYTDGVAEATDAHNELYGTERMLDALNQNPDAAPAEVLAAVKQSVDAFVGDAPQFDDITMLCLRYTGPEKEDA